MTEEKLQMKEEIIHLGDKKYLTEIWNEIPSNAIINKTLPGLGATTCEINAKRHSIIIEPNVPVIEGKQEMHPEILGVTEKVKGAIIVEYLRGEVEYKKIVTTPESYMKVRKALIQLNINYLDEYFLLFDECEKVISEINYRETINLPMDDFWKFKNRSFITATPLDFYPAAFTQRGFKKITIDPDMVFFWTKIMLVYTHNVLATVKALITTIKIKPDLDDFCCCYFVNSIDMIDNIIKNADIKDLCNIYCSEKSITKLQTMGYDRVYSSLNKLGSINFFTSRFYSAVDIITDKSTHVTIITDCKFAPQTMVHPQTESLQIVGRFRNGVVSFHHITNYDKRLRVDDFVESIEAIEKAKEGYDAILTLYNTAIDEKLKAVYKEALQKIDISRFVTQDHKLNFFKLVNVHYKQIVQNIYSSRLILHSYYLKNHNIQDLEHVTFRRHHKFVDNRFFSRSTSTKKESRKQIVEELSLIKDTDPEIISRLEQIEREDPLIMSAFVILGKEYIESVNYKESKLYTEIIKRSAQNGETFRPVMDAVLNIFKIGYEYFDSEIKEKLQSIYNELDYEVTASATDLGYYFNLSERKTIRKYGKSDKGRKIESAKYRKEKLGQISSLLDHFKKCPKITLENSPEGMISQD
jgi:hypothetical protein